LQPDLLLDDSPKKCLAGLGLDAEEKVKGWGMLGWIHGVAPSATREEVESQETGA